MIAALLSALAALAGPGTILSKAGSAGLAASTTPIESRILLPRLSLSGAACFTAALLGGCDSAGEDHQSVSVTLRGNGRNIAARFDYPCRAGRGGGAAAYVPVPSSILYIAEDRQALLLTAPQPHEPALCAANGHSGFGPGQAVVPTLVWIDDVARPTRIDRIGMSSVAAHRQGNLPELVHFSHISGAVPPPASPTPGRSVHLADPVTALSGTTGAAPRFLAPGRRLARIEFGDDAQRTAFRRLLGPEAAPGARSLDLCALAAIADGAAWLARELPAAAARCPERPAAIAAGRINFAVSLPMKAQAAGAWLSGGGDGIASYVADAQSPIERGPPVPGESSARAAQFWADHVRTIVWTTIGGRRIELPARVPSIHYIEDDQNLLIVLGDVEMLFFNNPVTWRRL